MLSAGSVQEAQDFALVSHAATLAGQGSLPALLRRLPHFARDRQDRHAVGRRHHRVDPRRRRRHLPVAGYDTRRAGRAGHGAEPRRVLPGPGGGEPVPPRGPRRRGGGLRRARRSGPVGGTGSSSTTVRSTRSGSSSSWARRRARWRRRSTTWSRPVRRSGWCGCGCSSRSPATALVGRVAAGGAVDRGARPHQGARRRRRAALPVGARGAGRVDGHPFVAVRGGCHG